MTAGKKRVALFVSLLFAAALAAPACRSQKQKLVSEKWYRVLDEGQPHAYVHLVQKESGDANAPVLSVHEWALDEGEHRGKTETWCKEDAFFSPVKIIVWSPDGTKVTATVTRTGADSSAAGKLVITESDGKQTESDIPAHTVAGWVIFSIVPRLPFDKEKVFSFNWMDEPKIPLRQGNYTVSYLGEEEITLGGQKTKLHGFAQKREDGRVEWEYWVNEKRELVLMGVNWGLTQMLLCTEQEAKAALKGK